MELYFDIQQLKCYNLQSKILWWGRVITISSANNSIIVAGTGSQTAFSFNFVGAASSDITVASMASNGTLTSISPSNYSVSLNAAQPNQLWGVGGVVTYPLVGSPLPTGSNVVISRIIPLKQQITTQNQGNYYAAVTEQALDTLEMQLQQVSGRTTQFRGIWATGVYYNQGDIVQDGVNGSATNNYYLAQVANTAGTWATDLASGYWTVSALAAVPTGSLTLTGDVTGAGASPIATTLATVNSTTGAFTNASITVDAKGRITHAASGSAGGTGTVTSVTYTGDGVLQSSTPSTAVTSSGTVAATILTQAANTVLAGPTSGGNANPTFRALVSADLPAGSTGVVSVHKQIFTASGTYTPTTGMLYCIAEAVGSGGGSANSTSSNVTGGGGAGEYGRVVLTAAQIGSSQTVTIGSAGGVGGAGGSVSLGTLLVCAGGSAGGANTVNSAGGLGGTGGGAGDIKVPGQAGGVSLYNSSAVFYLCGGGGNSFFGSGGPNGTGTQNGVAGIGYGSGGSGGTNGGTGASGAKGIIWITEYCSQ